MKKALRPTFGFMVLITIGLLIFLPVGAEPIQATSMSPNDDFESEPSGRIVSIVEALSTGGSTVSVSVGLIDGILPESSLELFVHTFQDSVWTQTMNQRMELGPLSTESASVSQPRTYVFTNITMAGNPDYKVSVIWRNDELNSGYVIDQMIGGHYRVGTYDSLSIIVFSLGFAFIAVRYMRQLLHNKTIA